MPLPNPRGRQAEVLALPPVGHIVVLGTAGSGKSTLAILRSAFLGSPNQSAGGATLLLTFNVALVQYLRHLKSEAEDPSLANVTIENYHKFARGYLNSLGKMRADCICQHRARERAIELAIASCKKTSQSES